MFAIRQGSWKREIHPGDAEAAEEGLPAVQLCDVSIDISETKNVRAEHPEVVTRLTKLLEKYPGKDRSIPGGGKQSNDVSVAFGKTITRPQKEKAALKKAVKESIRATPSPK